MKKLSKKKGGLIGLLAGIGAGLTIGVVAFVMQGTGQTVPDNATCMDEACVNYTLCVDGDLVYYERQSQYKSLGSVGNELGRTIDDTSCQ